MIAYALHVGKVLDNRCLEKVVMEHAGAEKNMLFKNWGLNLRNPPPCCFLWVNTS
jgi:hypothetical protein